MPYALPSPSSSPTHAASASTSRTETSRPPRDHMRSQSSDGIASSAGFIFVQPASPEGPSSRSHASASSGNAIAGPSKDTVPRKPRRARLAAFTVAREDGPSSQEESPAGGASDAGQSVYSDSPSAHSPVDRNADVQGPPLVPVTLRTMHAKAASTPAATRSLAAELSQAFPNVRQTAMLRKKSGELVRSSLKTDFGRDRSHKPRSEPATPTCPKYLHFDTQLEHVKHFLSQQRPAAVSRSGSPIDTETEDEPEAFPFPAMATPLVGTLQIKLPNFPVRVNHGADAYVESIEVAQDGKSLRGIVRVKNLAFEKWVAVRFTLDNWQTVSEVSGEHLESMGPMSDRFVFTIKLQDLLARIEEKTMFVAVRYTVGGREIWDNNDGANYRIEFVKETPKPAAQSPSGTGVSGSAKRQTWSVTNAGQAADRMADLRRELDRLVQDDFDKTPIAASTRVFSDHHGGSGGAFSTPYDFGNSLKMYSGGNRSASLGTAPQTSPTKPVSPYASTNYVNGMPATVFPDPSSSPTLSRANLAPDFGSYKPQLPYPQFHLGEQQPPSPPPEVHSALFGDFKPYTQLQESVFAPSTAPPPIRNRFHSFPGRPESGSNGLSPYVPLLPPSFREQRRRDSPFASPADSPVESPALSPASSSPQRASSPSLYHDSSPDDVWSPASSADTVSTNSTSSSRSASTASTSTYSPESDSTSVPESPSSGFPNRASGPSEFSSFLDRYYFHQSASSHGSSDGYGTPLPSDFSTTPRHVSVNGGTSCSASSFNFSPTSSGASTPNREDAGTRPMDSFANFIGLGPPAITS